MWILNFGTFHLFYDCAFPGRIEYNLKCTQLAFTSVSIVDFEQVNVSWVIVFHSCYISDKKVQKIIFFFKVFFGNKNR